MTCRRIYSSGMNNCVRIFLKIRTSLCWASTVGSQHDATHICWWALAPAARRPKLSNDICCRRYCTATNPLAAIVAVNWRDRQTDGRPTVTQTPLRMRAFYGKMLSLWEHIHQICLVIECDHDKILCPQTFWILKNFNKVLILLCSKLLTA